MSTRDPFGWVGHALDERYDIESVAGAGGFGVVYRAHHRTLDAPVAIKFLRLPQELDEEGRREFERRFVEEGRVLHRLSRASASIVQALDVGAVTAPNGSFTPYLVLEWLEGTPLDDVLERRAKEGTPPPEPHDAMRWLRPAAEALSEAHDQRIAHRDVKPANLFLARVGEREVVKVLDFGIAKVIHDSVSQSEALRRTGFAPRAFTPQYGAPEQFDRRKGATGPWTDVHALALVFVELLVGRPALEGDDVVQLMTCALDERVRPTPRALGIDVGDELERVLGKALALLPEDRYPDARSFLRELESAIEASVDQGGRSGVAPERLAPRSRDALVEANLDTAAFLESLSDTAAPNSQSGAPLADSKVLAEASRGGQRVDEQAESNARERELRGSPRSVPEEVIPSRSAATTAPTVADALTGSLVEEERVEAPERRGSRLWLLAAAVVALIAAGGLASRMTVNGDSTSAHVTSDGARGEQTPERARAGETSALQSLDATDRATEAAKPPAKQEDEHDAMPSARTTAPPQGEGSARNVADSSTRKSEKPGGASAESVAREVAAPSSDFPHPRPQPKTAEPKVGIAEADDALDPEVCGSSCRVDGQCSPSIVGGMLRCRAGSDSDCRRSYMCTVHGACHAKKGICLALTQADCDASQGCKETGECRFASGKCLQSRFDTDADCRKTPGCKQGGRCTAQNNGCIATSEEECRVSESCKSRGYCRLVGTSCVK